MHYINGNKREVERSTKTTKKEGDDELSVVEGAEESHALLNPNALISLRGNFDVGDEIRRVTRRR